MSNLLKAKNAESFPYISSYQNLNPDGSYDQEAGYNQLETNIVNISVTEPGTGRAPGRTREAKVRVVPDKAIFGADFAYNFTATQFDRDIVPLWILSIQSMSPKNQVLRTVCAR